MDKRYTQHQQTKVHTNSTELFSASANALEEEMEEMEEMETQGQRRSIRKLILCCSAAAVVPHAVFAALGGTAIPLLISVIVLALAVKHNLAHADHVRPMMEPTPRGQALIEITDVDEFTEESPGRGR